MAKTESPSLWASISEDQVFMVSMMTAPLGAGPAATATSCIPDLDNFRGSFGGKHVIPLYRDAARAPNVFEGTLQAITNFHAQNDASAPRVKAEDLFAYCYAILAGTDYTQRFEEELRTPGPRVPLTSDGELFQQAVKLGKRLLWFHTFGTRFTEAGAGDLILRDDVRVVRAITELPQSSSAIIYDSELRHLRIGDGEIALVSPEVWSFEVSGMEVVKKWLGYRTATPAGRAARSGSPLDRLRPETWLADWSTELLEVISVLQSTLDLLPQGTQLLDDILMSPLIANSALPPVPESLLQVPTVSTMRGSGFRFEL